MNTFEGLNDLRNLLFDFSKRNTFVHIRKNNLWIIEDDNQSNLADKISKKAKFYQKEYGLETSLKVSVFIEWLPPAFAGKSQGEYFCSPLFYQPCSIKKEQKITVNYSVTTEDQTYITNPVLKHYFALFYNLNLPEKFTDLDNQIETILSFFNEGESNERIKIAENFDPNQGWQIIKKEAVGIFNYKKSSLAADYTTIQNQNSPTIKHLLEGETQLESRQPRLAKLISSLDASQHSVVNRALSENLVIQGPPGTGKSHTIVALIGALLAENRTVLFISEKKSALDVVANRLTKKGLSELIAFFNTGKNQKKFFYQQVKKAWENRHVNDRKLTELSSNLNNQNLALYPEKIRGKIKTLIDIILKAGVPLQYLESEIQVPSFDEWQKHHDLLSQLSTQLLSDFNEEFLSNTSFAQLNPVLFKENDVVNAIEKRINEIENTIVSVNKVSKDYNLSSNYTQFMHLAITASILDMVNKVQLDLLNDASKKFNSFNRWAKKYQLLKAKVQQAEKANAAWSKKPSISEITELIDIIKRVSHSKSRSVFRILKRNPSRLKEAFRDFHSGISQHTQLKLLDGLQLEWRLKNELEEVKIKLKHNLNITNPDHEIDLIFNLRSKLNSLSQSEYLFLLEHENSEDLIQVLSKIHPEIQRLNALIRYLFAENHFDNIDELSEKVSKIRLELPQINRWLPELKELFQLPKDIRDYTLNTGRSIKELQAIVAYQNLLQETRFEPHFKSLSGWSYLRELQMEQANEQRIHQNNIQNILIGRSKKLEALNNLLQTPAFKLKGHDKSLKRELKQAKRLLIHEMNKQQRHLPVRDYYETCQSFLKEIQPVWMMNPLTVAENLPCLPELFDVVIFDESSQIPLEDALPSIFRAKQAIIVGDSNQMPPSRFFSSQLETKTLLDQAEISFNTRMLTWHYRSKHPQLIQFSNHHFYDNQLITLPASVKGNAIEVFECNGVFEAGVNRVEAEKIADYCVNTNFKHNDVLIIAFSQEQEKLIRKLLNQKTPPSSLKTKIRNLENAQGIEAETVIISVGYGFNSEGSFNMNFGPINRINGAKRLNVLFTRAIRKMVIFKSISSSHLSLSSNHGITILKDFLDYCEHIKQPENRVKDIPYAHQLIYDWVIQNRKTIHYYPSSPERTVGYFINDDRSKILLVDPGLHPNDVASTNSFIKALFQHFKSVKIILSIDLWLNKERVKQEVLEFFPDD